jgi:3'(2'), 5'-bisphosphate nucleotidase
MNQPSPSAHLLCLMQIAHKAGAKIMAIYNSGFEVASKSDASPVTEADTAAEAIILEQLRKLEPDANIIAEEAVSAGATPRVTPEFYLVDPLDGTREFISRNGEFTVNIALIKNGAPVAGVVYAPALSTMYAGELASGALEMPLAADAPWADSPDMKPITCPRLPASGIKVVASRSHRDEATDDWLAKRDVAEIVAAGSSLKFCLLAAGKAHLYPRFGRTMEWDTAAGHAVLAAAGGEVFEADGSLLRYGKQHRGFDNPAFIASVSKDQI